jgi:hypothetical protein
MYDRGYLVFFLTCYFCFITSKIIFIPPKLTQEKRIWEGIKLCMKTTPGLFSTLQLWFSFSLLFQFKASFFFFFFWEGMIRINRINVRKCRVSSSKPKVGSKELGVGLRLGQKNILTQREVGLRYWIVVTCFQGDKGETWQITVG